MSIKKEKRNIEIISLINKGLDYRSLAEVFKMKFPRIYQINKFYNSEKAKKSETKCVRCGRKTDLMLKDKIRNICKNCVKEINSL